MEIREKQIEDILVSSPALMQKTFGLNEEPRLIGRQIIVPSGRLDMLYTYQKDLFLIELKVASFQKRFIKQVLDYKNDLLLFQKQGKLISGDIIPFLLMPQTSKNNRNEIEAKGIILQEYNPEEILSFFYSERLRPITTFSELKPVDVGIWNIHLINKFIYNLSETNSISDLRTIVGGSRKTLYDKIRFADELGLLNWSPKGDYIGLTKLGEQYVAAKDKYLDETLSEDQAKLLKDHVMQNPYDSASASASPRWSSASSHSPRLRTPFRWNNWSNTSPSTRASRWNGRPREPKCTEPRCIRTTPSTSACSPRTTRASI